MSWATAGPIRPGQIGSSRSRRRRQRLKGRRSSKGSCRSPQGLLDTSCCAGLVASGLASCWANPAASLASSSILCGR